VKEGSAEACLCTAAQHVQHLHLEDCSISSRRLLSQLVTSSPSLKQLTLVDVRTAARCKGKKGNPSDEVPQHTELLSAVSPASGLRLSLSAVVWSLIGQVGGPHSVLLSPLELAWSAQSQPGRCLGAQLCTHAPRQIACCSTLGWHSCEATVAADCPS
jgi:hypothetical protein